MYIGITGISVLYRTINIAWAVEVALRLMSTYDVVVEDVGGAFEVGDGAGDFEDAVVGSRAHVHAVHGVFQFFKASGVGLGVFVEQ